MKKNLTILLLVMLTLTFCVTASAEAGQHTVTIVYQMEGYATRELSVDDKSSLNEMALPKLSDNAFRCAISNIVV